MEYRRLLASVGIKTFVEVFTVFEASRFEDSDKEVRAALREKGVWKESSITTKAWCGKKIFETDNEITALMYIAEKAKNVERDTQEKAWEILQSKGITTVSLYLKYL
jgi:hypothetical protein